MQPGYSWYAIVAIWNSNFQLVTKVASCPRSCLQKSCLHESLANGIRPFGYQVLDFKVTFICQAITQPMRNWLPGLSYDEIWEQAFVDLPQMFGCNWVPLLSLLLGTVHQTWDVLSHQPRFSSALLPWAHPEINTPGGGLKTFENLTYWLIPDCKVSLRKEYLIFHT